MFSITPTDSHTTLKYMQTHTGNGNLSWSAGIVSDDDRSPQGAETVWIQCSEEVEQVTVLETVKKMMPGVKDITALYDDNYDRQAEDYCLANNINYAEDDTIYGSESEVILYYIVQYILTLTIQVVINMAGGVTTEELSRARERTVIVTWPDRSVLCRQY